MTRVEVLEVVYRYYPRGLPSHDPAYDDTEERRRLAAAARRAAAEYPTWKSMIRRLGNRYSLQDDSVSLLAGWVEPAYSARIYLPGEITLGFHVSALGPYYAVHHSGSPGDAPAAAAVNDVAQEIEATYPGHQRVPPEIGNEAPEVSLYAVPDEEVTIYICLLSDAWTWVT